jgi:hypothetical protein
MPLSLGFLVIVVSCVHNDALRSGEWCRDAAVFVSADGSVRWDTMMTYFRTHSPSAAEQKEIPTWVKSLGDDDFATRERASRKLIDLGRAARPALQQGLQLKNPDVRRRCAECLWETDNVESYLAQKLRFAVARKSAYSRSISIYEYMIKKGESGLEEMIPYLRSLIAEHERDAARVERMLRRLGMGSEELENIKRVKE